METLFGGTLVHGRRERADAVPVCDPALSADEAACAIFLHHAPHHGIAGHSLAHAGVGQELRVALRNGFVFHKHVVLVLLNAVPVATRHDLGLDGRNGEKLHANGRCRLLAVVKDREHALARRRARRQGGLEQDANLLVAAVGKGGQQLAARLERDNGTAIRATFALERALLRRAGGRACDAGRQFEAHLKLGAIERRAPSARTPAIDHVLDLSAADGAGAVEEAHRRKTRLQQMVVGRGGCDGEILDFEFAEAVGERELQLRGKRRRLHPADYAAVRAPAAGRVAHANPPVRLALGIRAVGALLAAEMHHQPKIARRRRTLRKAQPIAKRIAHDAPRHVSGKLRRHDRIALLEAHRLRIVGGGLHRMPRRGNLLQIEHRAACVECRRRQRCGAKRR